MKRILRRLYLYINKIKPFKHDKYEPKMSIFCANFYRVTVNFNKRKNQHSIMISLQKVSSRSVKFRKRNQKLNNKTKILADVFSRVVREFDYFFPFQFIQCDLLKFTRKCNWVISIIHTKNLYVFRQTVQFILKSAYVYFLFLHN